MSTHSGFFKGSKKTAPFIIFLAVALIAGIIPFMANEQPAQAVDCSTAAAVTSAAQTANTTIRLTGSISLSSSEYSSGGIVIAAKGIVLDLNGYVIHAGGLEGNDQTGTSGACVTVNSSASLVVKTTSNSIVLTSKNTNANAIYASTGGYTGQTSSDNWRTSYGSLIAIKNSGFLRIEQGVTIEAYSHMECGTTKSNSSWSFYMKTCCICNLTSSATTILNNGCFLNSFADSNARDSSGYDGNSRNWAYNVYGGIIIVNGGYLKAVCDSYCNESGKSGYTDVSAITFNVASQDGQITINGGYFAFNSRSNGDSGTGSSGSDYVHCGAVLYGSVIPVISDGSTAPYGTGDASNDSFFQCFWQQENSNQTSNGNTLTNYCVSRCDSSSCWDRWAPTALVNRSTEEGNSKSYYSNASTYYAAPYCGVYKTEDGTLNYNINNEMSWGGQTGSSKPSANYAGLLNGVAEVYSGTTATAPSIVRVHFVYRIWGDSSRTVTTGTASTNDFNESVPNYTSPTVSYAKPSWVTTDVSITNGTKEVSSNLSSTITVSGGDPTNAFYFNQISITSGYVSDCGATYYGGVNFNTVKLTNTSGTASSGAVYIFVDYCPVATRDLTINVSSVSKVYDGTAVTASCASGQPFAAITIYQGSNNVTSVFTNNGVFYTSTGIRKAVLEWKNVNTWQSTNFPTAVGTYSYRVHIAADNSSNTDTNSYNINEATSATFTVSITKATPTVTNLPSPYTITYGALLNTINFGSYSAKGVGTQASTNISGTFAFKTASDGTVQHNAGETGSVLISWTSGDSNYNDTTFTMTYSVSSRSITVAANSCSFTYGLSNGDFIAAAKNAGLTFGGSGLASWDQSLAATITSGATYKVMKSGTASDHAANDNVGTYTIVPSGGTTGNFNTTNYSISYLTTGVLTVTQKNLTISGTGGSRIYDGTAVAPVSFTINGVVTGDSIFFGYQTTYQNTNQANANFASADVGTGIAWSSWVNAPSIWSASTYPAANYTYTLDTSAIKLTITQKSVNYKQVGPYNITYSYGETLNDLIWSSQHVAADGTDPISYPAGTWTWTSGTTVPTHNVSSYTAKFTPDNTGNYTTATNVPVTVNVAQKQVIVSTTPLTLTYGDAAPSYDNKITYTVQGANTTEAAADFITNLSLPSGNVVITANYYTKAPVSGSPYAVGVNTSACSDPAGNYYFTAQNGTVAVLPKAVTVTVPSAAITFGQAYSFDGTGVGVTGLVSGDTNSALTTNGANPSWTVSTTYAQFADVGSGTFPITISLSNQSSNYSFSYVQGTLTVNKAALTITADNKNVTYGDAVPSYTYTLTGLVLTDASYPNNISTMLASGSSAPSFAGSLYTTSSNVNSAGYAIKMGISGVVCKNYTLTAVDGKVFVSQKQSAITGSVIATLTYSETYGDAVFSGFTAVPSGGTFTFTSWSSSDTPLYSYSGNTYSFTYTPKTSDQNNYSAVSGTCTLHINKKTVSGTVGISGNAMVGKVLTADLADVDPSSTSYFTFAWYVDNTLTTTTTTTYSILAADKGKTAYVMITAKTDADCPYTGSLTSAPTSKISPKLTLPGTAQLEWSRTETGTYSTSFTFTSAQYGTVVYDAQTHSVYVRQNATVGSNCLGALTIKYGGKTDVPTEAGTYRVTVDIGTLDSAYTDDVHDGDPANGEESGKTYNASHNVVYGPVSNLYVGEIKIDQTPLNVTFSAADKTYDGDTTATLSGSFSASGYVAGQTASDVYLADTDNIALSFADENVGTGKTVTALGGYLAGAKAADYSLVYGTASASITPRPISATAVAYGRVYQPGVATVPVTFTGLGEKDGYTLADRDSTDPEDENCVYISDGATANLSSPNVGTYTLSSFNVTLAGNEAGNYTFTVANSGEISVTITQATPDVTVPAFSDTYTYKYNGSLSSDFSLNPYANWTWVDGSVNPTAGTRKYSLTYDNGDSNYKTITTSTSIKVNKCTLTMQPVANGSTSAVLVYGAAVPTYSFTYTAADGLQNSGNAAAVFAANVSGQVSYSCLYSAGASVGTYNLSLANTLSSSNYNIVRNTSVITVAKRTVSTTAKATNRTYDSTAVAFIDFSELTNVYQSDDVYLNNYQVTATIPSSQAGSYTINGTMYTAPTLQGNKAGNYALTITNPSSITVIISKADPSNYTFPSAATMDYGSKLSTAVFSNDSKCPAGGSFAMKNGDSYPTVAGTFYGSATNPFKVIYYPPDTTNYNVMESDVIMTINKQTLNQEQLKVDMYGDLTAGQNAFVQLNSTPADAQQYLVYSWYLVSSADATLDDCSPQNYLGSGSSVSLSNDDVGYYLLCKVTVESSDSPYIGSTYKVSASKIVEETLTFWQKLWKWITSLIKAFTAFRLGR